jgi:hypothetical protein
MVFTTLMNHLAECVEGESKVHLQMIELIVLLIRNLLTIPDDQSVGLKGNLQRVFIEVLIEE